MLVYIISFLIIAGTVVFFLLPKRAANPPQKPPKKTEKPQETQPKEKEKKKEEPISQVPQKTFDKEKNLIKSFKDIKDLKSCYFFNNGHVIIFSDEKRISFCYIEKFNSKTQKIISRNVESDLIADIDYSEKKRLIVCGLKNSKKICSYTIENENGKNKLAKTPNDFQTERKNDIRHISITKEGSYISTSGSEQDTEIQIFDASKKDLKLFEVINTSGIKNFEMKITPSDDDILISTYMNDISVIHINKTQKFNNTTLKDDTIVKFVREKSVSGIKDLIIGYEFSNDPQFFVVGCQNQTVKIMQNFGKFSESKVFSEFKVDYKPSAFSLYVESFFNGKIQGFIAIGSETNIYVYNCQGELLTIITEAHPDTVFAIKVIKGDLSNPDENKKEKEDLRNIEFDDEKDKNGSPILISASRDGRIKLWNLEI